MGLRRPGHGGDRLIEEPAAVDMTVVYIDTTELVDAPRLDRGGWPQLFALSRADLVEIVISEVSLREAARKYGDRLAEDFAKLQSAARRHAEARRPTGSRAAPSRRSRPAIYRPSTRPSCSPTPR